MRCFVRLSMSRLARSRRRILIRPMVLIHIGGRASPSKSSTNATTMLVGMPVAMKSTRNHVRR